MGVTGRRMESISFEAHPDWVLKCKLFRDVTNAEELGQLIVGGKVPVRTSLVNAKLVPALLPLYVAGDKTLRSLKTDKGIVTRTLGSELVYNLAASKHIRDSLVKFGVKKKDCTEVLLAWFEPKEVDGAAASRSAMGGDEDGDISPLIKGTPCDLADLRDKADSAKIKTHYKIQDKELGTSTLTDCVVFRIGAKEFLEKQK